MDLELNNRFVRLMDLIDGLKRVLLIRPTNKKQAASIRRFKNQVGFWVREVERAKRLTEKGSLRGFYGHFVMRGYLYELSEIADELEHKAVCEWVNDKDRRRAEKIDMIRRLTEDVRHGDGRLLSQETDLVILEFMLDEYLRQRQLEPEVEGKKKISEEKRKEIMEMVFGKENTR